MTPDVPIRKPEPYVIQGVARGREAALPLTDAVSAACRLMTGRPEFAHLFPLDVHPEFRSVLEGFCPGFWRMLSPGDGCDADRFLRRRAGRILEELGLDGRRCRPLEAVFDGDWGHCRTCGYYYRHTDGARPAVYRVQDRDLYLAALEAAEG